MNPINPPPSVENKLRLDLGLGLGSAARQTSLSFTISLSLLKFMSTESATLSNQLIFCHFLLLLPSIVPSIRVFASELAFHIRWSKIGASTSTSVLLMNIQEWFPLGLTGLISLLSKGLSRVFSNTTVQKHQFFNTQPSLWSNSHFYSLNKQNAYVVS